MASTAFQFINFDASTLRQIEVAAPQPPQSGLNSMPTSAASARSAIQLQFYDGLASSAHANGPRKRKGKDAKALHWVQVDPTEAPGSLRFRILPVVTPTVIPSTVGTAPLAERQTREARLEKKAVAIYPREQRRGVDYRPDVTTQQMKILPLKAPPTFKPRMRAPSSAFYHRVAGSPEDRPLRLAKAKIPYSYIPPELRLRAPSSGKVKNLRPISRRREFTTERPTPQYRLVAARWGPVPSHDDYESDSSSTSSSPTDLSSQLPDIKSPPPSPSPTPEADETPPIPRRGQSFFDTVLN